MTQMKKPPVGAHYGLRDWILQRASAVLMLVAIIILAVAFFVQQPNTYEEWRGFVLTSWVRIVLLMTVLAAAWHGYIGARDVFMDYIKHDGLRLFKTAGTAVYVITCAVWAAHILL